MAKKYTEFEIDFLKKNYCDKGAGYCAEVLKRPYQALIFKANSLGLLYSHEKRSQIHTEALKKPNNWYNINPDQFFNIQKPEVAYFLGYFWADGHVNNHIDSSYHMAMEIQKPDYLSIKSTLDAMGLWSIYFRKRISKPDEDIQNRQESAIIKTGNKPLVLFLLEHDYGNKSHLTPTKILSKIPNHLEHYWWRGYMDGDGSFPKPGSTRMFCFYSTQEQDWTEHQKILEKLDISYTIDRTKKSLGNCSLVRSNNTTNVYKWGSYIYQGYQQDKIGLFRKYEKWLDVVPDYNEFCKHDNLVVDPILPFNEDNMLKTIQKYDKLLSRRKLIEAYGLPVQYIDKAARFLKDQGKITRIGKSVLFFRYAIT